jgi:hypothetical protein
MALHSINGQVANALDVDLNRPSLGTGLVSPVIEGQAIGKVVTKSNQIIVNDGENDRILIGFQAGGF